jgi:hypothetical protein
MSVNALYIKYLQSQRRGYYPIDLKGSEAKNRKIINLKAFEVWRKNNETIK